MMVTGGLDVRKDSRATEEIRVFGQGRKWRQKPDRLRRAR